MPNVMLKLLDDESLSLSALHGNRVHSDWWQLLARRTRRLGRPAGPVIGVPLPRRTVGRNGAFALPHGIAAVGQHVTTMTAS